MSSDDTRAIELRVSSDADEDASVWQANNGDGNSTNGDGDAKSPHSHSTSTASSPHKPANVSESFHPKSSKSKTTSKSSASSPAPVTLASVATLEMNERHERVLNIYFARRPLLKRICQSSLRFVLPITLFCFIFPALVNYGVCRDLYLPEASSLCRTNATATFALFHVISLLTTAFSSALLLFELSHHIVNPWHLTSMYASVVVHYASWYQLCLSGELNAISIPTTDPSSDILTRLVVCVYLSVSIMTTAGLGDVVPNLWYAKFIAITQMLIGMLYTTGVFAIGLDHFRKMLETPEPPALHESWITRRTNAFFEAHPRLNIAKDLILNNMLLVTVVLQLLLMGFLVAAYGHTKSLFEEDATTDGVQFLCLFFEAVQFILVIFSTYRLIRSTEDSTIGLWSLVQSYLAVCGLFGGVYFTLYVLAGANSFSIRAIASSSTSVPATFGEFVYLSVAIMTTTGFGDDTPIHTAARIFVSLEMLTGLFYAVVILGIGVARVVHAWKSSKVELPPMPEEMEEV